VVAPILGYHRRWLAACVLLALALIFPAITLYAQLTTPFQDESDRQMGLLFDMFAGGFLIILIAEFAVGWCVRHIRSRHNNRPVGEIFE
jgi:heme/copper-type cytochrome/quinol oxidase subunit 2